MVPDSWSPRRCSSFLLAHYVCRNCNNSVRYSAQTSTYKIRDTLLAQKTSLPFPSANRSVLSTRWQAHKPRRLRQPKQLGHSSKKPRFLSSTDRSFVRDDRNGLPQEASARFILHIINADRIIFSTMLRSSDHFVHLIVRACHVPREIS